MSIILMYAALTLQSVSAPVCRVHSDEAVTACTAGQIGCCPNAAFHLMFRDQVDSCALPDFSLAAALLSKACENGNGRSCRELAVRAGRDLPGFPSRAEMPAIRTRATMLLSQNCDAGDSDACKEGAAEARGRPGGVPDPEREAALERKYLQIIRTRCDTGDLAGCESLALDDLQKGTRVDSALATLESLCQRGSESACVSGFRSRASGVTAPQTKRLMEILESGCEQKVVAACVDLSYIALRSGSKSGVRKWGMEACDAGSGVSCHEVADSFGNKAEALMWRKKGCALGVRHATCPPRPGECVSTGWPPDAYPATRPSPIR